MSVWKGVWVCCGEAVQRSILETQFRTLVTVASAEHNIREPQSVVTSSFSSSVDWKSGKRLNEVENTLAGVRRAHCACFTCSCSLSVAGHGQSVRTGHSTFAILGFLALGEVLCSLDLTSNCSSQSACECNLDFAFGLLFTVCMRVWLGPCLWSILHSLHASVTWTLLVVYSPQSTVSVTWTLLVVYSPQSTVSVTWTLLVVYSPQSACECDLDLASGLFCTVCMRG